MPAFYCKKSIIFLTGLLTMQHRPKDKGTCTAYKEELAAAICNCRSGALKKLFLIMNFTATFLLVCCLQVSAALYSQTVSFSGKQVALKDVFSAIRQQTGYTVAANARLLNTAGPVTVEARNEPLPQFLTRLLSGRSLQYEIINKTILLSEKPGAPPVSVREKQAAEQLPALMEVRGRVTDSSGVPLAGASVKIKSTTAGVTTNSNGEFVINAKETDILVISYIGYRAIELPANSKALGMITLLPVENQLDDLVVVGYGTQRRKDVTGAISQIKPRDLNMVATPSVAQMLLGTASGVTVQQLSAQPGGGISIYIRGQASTGAGNSPLWVVDGFPLSDGDAEPGSGNRYSYGSRNPLNTLNPYDIESIEVLKDAAATAIYGSRAGNGVIVVTTKKGKSGKPAVTYNFSQSVQEITRNFDVLNATEYMQTANEAAYERWLFDNAIFPYGNTIPENAKIPYQQRYTDAQVAHAGEGTDWLKLVTRKGDIQQHNISITGGSEYTKYAVTGNYFNQHGVVKNSDFKRYSVRTNIEQKLSNIFNTGLNLTLSQVDNRNASLGDNLWENSSILTNAIQFPPIYPVYDAEGNYLINPVYSPMANPVSMLEIADNTITKRVLGTVFLEARIGEGLKANVNFGLDNQLGKRNQYLPKTMIYGLSVNGDAQISTSEKFDKKLTATLNYAKKLKKEHSVDALAGYEYTNFDATGFNAGAKDFFTDILLYNDLGAGSAITRTAGSYRAPSNELASYFTRLNYSFADKYYLGITGRYDGSSKFGANNKWAFFPSASFKWRAIAEPFLEASQALSDLALRISWGQAGNQNIGQNAFSYYSSGYSYAFGTPGKILPGVTLSQLDNPDLKWETSTTINLGLDFGLFKNRLTGSVEVYKKTVDGLLSARALPSWYPVGSVADNIGSTQDKGIEITLDSKNFTGPFKWNTHFTLSHFKDTWRNRNENVILQPYEHKNDPLRPAWTYLFDGILQIGEEPPYAQPLLLPGQEKIKDVNNDGKIDINDLALAGTTDPTVTLGLGNTLEFKNFDINLFFTGMFGRNAVEDANWSRWGVGVIDMINQGYNLMSDVQKRWVHDRPGTIMYSGTPSVYQTSNKNFWFNGNFVRCRNITLGYRLPAVKKVFSSCRLFADVNNAFIITKYPYMDPETNTRAGYPNQRSYSLGVDISF
ncbi:TonB-dependent receptor [Niabella drilacis]|nr:TonB-dependent receptor [Niabella drilacis]